MLMVEAYSKCPIKCPLYSSFPNPSWGSVNLKQNVFLYSIFRVIIFHILLQFFTKYLFRVLFIYRNNHTVVFEG